MHRPAWPLLAGLLLLNIAVILVMAFVVPYDGPTLTLAPALRMEGRSTTIGMRGRYSILPPFSNPAVEPRPETTRIVTSDYFLSPFGVQQKAWAGVGLYMASLVVMLGLYAPLLYLFPYRLRRVREAMDSSGSQALRTILTGILGYILVAGLVTLLTIIVIGMPLAVIIVLATILLSLAGLAAASLVIGRGLAKAVGLRPDGPLTELVFGILLLFPLSILPLVGWVMVALANSLGFGAILLTKFGSEEGWTLQG
ncbi:MAG: hypothetical protein HYX92_13115 [Chloroflexi bacterium]|nr:hypothetical protein [Chloroflexota bacterium]